MKTPYGRILSLAGIVAAMTGIGRGQDFFRDYGTSRSSGGIGFITPSEYNYSDASPSSLHPIEPFDEGAEADDYNFALGPVRFSLAAGIGVEFNDNITLSNDDRVSDIIFRPVINLDAAWRFSELNTLRFSIGVGYAKYLENSEYDTDGILISPNSDLALTIFVGAIKVTIRDRFSYQEDAYDVPTLSNVAQYKRFENQIGIQADWQINEALSLTVGYDHFNLWTSGDEFQSEDRAIDTIFIRPGWQINPALQIGLNASVSFIDFDSEDRPDGHTILLGPFIQYDLTEHTTIYLEGGLQETSFDGETFIEPDTTLNQAFFDELTEEERELFEDDPFGVESGDTSSWYVKFEIANELTENYHHKLSFSKTTEIAIGAGTYELYHVEYSAEWENFIEKLDIGPTLFWERYETSGPIGEEAWRFGAALGLRYHASNSITLGLDYRFLIKDSNLDDSDYYQNLVLLSFYYKF